jgi:hypothetical protein
MNEINQLLFGNDDVPIPLPIEILEVEIIDENMMFLLLSNKNDRSCLWEILLHL